MRRGSKMEDDKIVLRMKSRLANRVNVSERMKIIVDTLGDAKRSTSFH